MASDTLCLASTILIFDVEWEKTAVYKLLRLTREKCVLFACNQVVKRTRHIFGECRALRQYTVHYSIVGGGDTQLRTVLRIRDVFPVL